MILEAHCCDDAGKSLCTRQRTINGWRFAIKSHWGNARLWRGFGTMVISEYYAMYMKSIETKG